MLISKPLLYEAKQINKISEDLLAQPNSLMKKSKNSDKYCNKRFIIPYIYFGNKNRELIKKS